MKPTSHSYFLPPRYRGSAADIANSTLKDVLSKAKVEQTDSWSGRASLAVKSMISPAPVVALLILSACHYKLPEHKYAITAQVLSTILFGLFSYEAYQHAMTEAQSIKHYLQHPALLKMLTDKISHTLSAKNDGKPHEFRIHVPTDSLSLIYKGKANKLKQTIFTQNCIAEEIALRCGVSGVKGHSDLLSFLYTRCLASNLFDTVSKAIAEAKQCRTAKHRSPGGHSQAHIYGTRIDSAPIRRKRAIRQAPQSAQTTTPTSSSSTPVPASNGIKRDIIELTQLQSQFDYSKVRVRNTDGTTGTVIAGTINDDRTAVIGGVYISDSKKEDVTIIKSQLATLEQTTSTQTTDTTKRRQPQITQIILDKNIVNKLSDDNLSFCIKKLLEDEPIGASRTRGQAGLKYLRNLRNLPTYNIEFKFTSKDANHLRIWGELSTTPEDPNKRHIRLDLLRYKG